MCWVDPRSRPSLSVVCCTGLALMLLVSSFYGLNSNIIIYISVTVHGQKGCMKCVATFKALCCVYTRICTYLIIVSDMETSSPTEREIRALK